MDQSSTDGDEPSNQQPSTTKRTSILKKFPSPNKLQTEAPRTTKTAHFNEENIKETYHPANKDYGFDKISQPKTPFAREEAPIDPKLLKKRLQKITKNRNSSESENIDDDQPHSSGVTPSARSGKSQKSNKVNASVSQTSGDSVSFEEKRQNHYRAEFKIAKQAVLEEIDESQYSSSS
ncbi:protein phosphatase inhibitor 2-like [Episyrphus balteatus]|uniref:protein phosphatase inhibitor 2-like n=1 Tax=Episyrphus balteatus TaxID=286459 RepID=UPI0024861A6E|nr:protein phosphatase inhibitor 2-like [Episyrphus balteatus]XP_055847727.1 protein phosphatase inhibitor 2-like [Episyrphus balteatus]